MYESRILRRAREEGALIALRADILRVLSLRFGESTQAKFAAVLEQMGDVVQLEPMLVLAVTCQDVVGFRVGLEAQRALSLPDAITGYPGPLSGH
jgi:hypothetical protein